MMEPKIIQVITRVARSRPESAKEPGEIQLTAFLFDRLIAELNAIYGTEFKLGISSVLITVDRRYFICYEQAYRKDRNDEDVDEEIYNYLKY